MNCEVVQEKLSCYLDGVVDEATMEMIEDHLSVCSECRAELAALQTLSASMSPAFEVEPPASLKAAICEAIDRERIHSPECESVLAMLSEFVDGELVKKDRTLVQRHVDECERCAGELVMMQRTLASVGSLDEVEPPAELKSEIAAAVAKARRYDSPLGRLIRKTHAALQPAGLKWTAGALAAAATVVMATFLPMRQRDIVTVSEKPSPHVATLPVVPANTPVIPHRAASKVVAVTVQPAAGKPADSRNPKPTPKPSVRITTETIASATGAREASHLTPEALSIDSAIPGTGEPTATPVAKSEPTRGEQNPDSGKIIQAVAVAPAKPEDAKKEAAPAPAAKPAPVAIATEQPMIASQDNKTYIRSLKQQIRMKRRDEGITVDLLDVKF